MLHYILDVAVSDASVRITLDGGLSYEVAPDDLLTAATWYGSQQVRIVPARTRAFPVRLHHCESGQVIKARRFVGHDG